MNTVRVLSLGAGVQSSALYIAFLEGVLAPIPDFAVFADTQVEPAYVYLWLDKLESYGNGRLRIIRTTKGNLTEDHLKMKRSASIPFFIRNPDGSQGTAWRQCTKEYKIEAIRKAIRLELGYMPRQRLKHEIKMLIGISTDEASRMKPSRHKQIENIYPLIDEGWNRGDCINFIQPRLGNPPKSACYVCPYRSDESWNRMKRDDTESFEKAVQFERAVQLEQSKKKFDGIPFLHRSMRLLDQIDFNARAPEPAYNLFENECEGMCGV